MEFYLFHLMPWPYLPADFDEKYPSAWVTCPNDLYDPERGNALYNRYLDELELGEKLGFDGVCVNEHHQTSYGLMPAPNIIAATLARRTSRVKIALMGNAVPLRDHPMRIAEEVAMLDVITGGRIISGVVRGIGCEYYSFSLNPTTSRERFEEGIDLIIKAWTEPGPFSFWGKHYRLRYVNLWPKPFQKPHPPIWLPSTGSVETIEWSVKRRWPFIRTYDTLDAIASMYDRLRQKAQDEEGYDPPPEQIGWMLPIYVAETDEKARQEAAEHVQYLFGWLSKRPREFTLPPGYISAQSMVRGLEVAGAKTGTSRTADELHELGIICFGSPETVRQRLAEAHRRLGYGRLIGLLHFGSLPHELTVKNMTLFAEEVLPFIRTLSPSGASGNGQAARAAAPVARAAAREGQPLARRPSATST
jgi:alkanesulfonate monooxygenase SsuD/methylene tetrahydromethanopterin reductase-like flavin-dependent oxidoreductase (luciferase family)